MKELKTTQVSIRLTDSERRTIKKCAGDARMAEAEYIRNKVLDRKEKARPPGVVEILNHLLEANLSTARDINQMAREIRMQGSFSETDYQEILQYLEKLNRNYEKVAEQVTEVIL